MPRFAANLSMLFTEHGFLDRFDAAARVGFEAVEFVTTGRPEFAFREKSERDSGVCQAPRGKDLRAVRAASHQVPAGLPELLFWLWQLPCRAADGSTRS